MSSSVAEGMREVRASLGEGYARIMKVGGSPTNRIAVLVVLVIVLAFVVPLIGDSVLSGIVVIVLGCFAVYSVWQMKMANPWIKRLTGLVWAGFLVLGILGAAGVIEERMISTFAGVALAGACVLLIVTFFTKSRSDSSTTPSSMTTSELWKMCNDMVINGELVQRGSLLLGAVLVILASTLSTNHTRYLAFLATVAFTISVLSTNYTMWITVLAVAVLVVNGLYLFLVDHAPSVGGTPKDSTRIIPILNVLPAILIALAHLYLYKDVAKAIPGVSFQNVDETKRQEQRVRQLSEALAGLVAVYKFRTREGEEEGEEEGEAAAAGGYFGDKIQQLQHQINSLFVAQGGDVAEITKGTVEIFNDLAGLTSTGASDQPVITPTNAAVPTDILVKRINNLRSYLANAKVEDQAEKEEESGKAGGEGGEGGEGEGGGGGTSSD